MVCNFAPVLTQEASLLVRLVPSELTIFPLNDRLNDIKERKLLVSEMAETLIGSEIIRLAGEINEKIKQGEKIHNLTIGVCRIQYRVLSLFLPWIRIRLVGLRFNPKPKIKI